jgi:cytochrome c oxidase subunit 5b
MVHKLHRFFSFFRKLNFFCSRSFPRFFLRAFVMSRPLLLLGNSCRAGLPHFRVCAHSFLFRAKSTGHAPNSQVTSTPTTSHGRSSSVPSDLEQSTGLEREEYLLKREGKELFPKTITYDHYGTPERPTYIPCSEDSRIVGCSGFPRESHEYTFFELKKDEPQRCAECGQYFVLQHHESSLPRHHH